MQPAIAQEKSDTSKQKATQEKPTTSEQKALGSSSSSRKCKGAQDSAKHGEGIPSSTQAVEDDGDDYRCLVMEEPPPPNDTYRVNAARFRFSNPILRGFLNVFSNYVVNCGNLP